MLKNGLVILNQCDKKGKGRENSGCVFLIVYGVENETYYISNKIYIPNSFL